MIKFRELIESGSVDFGPVGICGSFLLRSLCRQLYGGNQAHRSMLARKLTGTWSEAIRQARNGATDS